MKMLIITLLALFWATGVQAAVHTNQDAGNNKAAGAACNARAEHRS